MIKFIFPLFLLALCPLNAQAQTTNVVPPPPVVLELFTSQGCGFCPPADELMGQMIKQQSVIGLSCHVDYFTVRKNSLGKSFCTARQNQYNKWIGKGPRYTPQLIVNGHMDLIGYEAGKVSAAILKGRAEKIQPISITLSDDGAYHYNLPKIATGADPINLWLAVFDAPKSMAIMEGNNLGKTVTYYNVVTQIQDLGAWDGLSASRTLNSSLNAQSNGFAILAQNTRTGNIVAAGSLNK